MLRDQRCLAMPAAFTSRPALRPRVLGTVTGASPVGQSMLPPEELIALRTTVANAVELAVDGAAADGYVILLSGVERARQARTEGNSWGEELVVRYEKAADAFARQFGL